jgi:hypothetical protein
MNKSTKAFLLSALLFPGCGHFYLKKPVFGALLTGISAVCLYFFTVSVISMAKQISDKILSGEVSADIVEISEAITKGLAETGIHQLNYLTILLFSCWIIGMVDSYRVGRKEDLKEE